VPRHFVKRTFPDHLLDGHSVVRVGSAEPLRRTWIRIGFVLAAICAAVVLPAAALAADTLSFGEAGATATFGANAIVRIDGSITYASDCPKPGINDFFYPATDVYLVEPGSEGGELHDVGGGRPNTIVSGASFFTDEVIGLTAPGGKLDDGVYDVVYDTCQDGQYDPGRDTIFHDAVTVDMPFVAPLADGGIGAIKDQARREYYSWLATRLAMNGLFKLADKAIKLQCDVGNPIGCAMKELDYFSGIKERFMALLLSESNHYLAIAEDPPDANYKTLTAVAPPALPDGHNDSALGNATADSLSPLDREAALTAALLHAVERYQGAQVAGDGEWALVHAREARNLVAALRTLVPSTDAALDELRSTVAGDAADLDAAIARGRTFVNRVWNSGLTADERRALRNQGRTDNQIAALETELRSFANSEGVNVDSASLLAALDESSAAHADTAAALDTAYAKWNDIVTAIEARKAPDTHPAIAAGGPYSAGEGAALQLGGSATGTIDAATWDLDGDGTFGDATGLTPSVSFPRAGTYVVALRATRDGNDAVSYAVVKVGDTNRAPVLSAPSPAERSATVVVGNPKTFSISASDPDGTPVSYSWLVDGAATGQTSSSFAFAPVAAQVGEHVVEVVASDGTVSGGATHRAWDVEVVRPDADGDGWRATPDCDESDPAVHPTANELLGNGIDDDCDTGTPDAPPGGLTGSMWSWGSNHNGTIGAGLGVPTLVHAPFAIPGYNDVVRVGSGGAVGYAVLANGEVRGWGSNGTAELGLGFVGSGQSTPVSPVPVGGGSGRLSGVTQITGSGGHAVALRVDGSVISWGDNQGRQIGDGSTVNYRLFPVNVVTSANGQPLTGVRSVEAGYVESYAVMNDGTVRAWGQIRCDGGSAIRIEPYPVPLSLVGGNVRQVSSGNQFTLILKKDGTVLSCGAVQPYSGRPVTASDQYVPKQVTGFGPGSGVVDIATGAEGGLALKDDGTVWAWGRNANGSLSVVGAPGNGSVPAPLQVPLPPGPPVVDIDMHNACHALALRADGSILSWGCDFFGQVGDGENTSDWIVETPTVISLPGASAYGISTSIWNSLVLTRPKADTAWERPETWVKASVTDAAVAEHDGGHFRISLSAALSHDVTVSYSLLAGTAGGGDLALGDGTATIPAGSQTVDVDVPVSDDALDEDDETFTIVLRDASNGIQLDRSQATGTIADDDAPPAVGIQPATVAEGDTSLTDATLSVQLSQPSGKQVAVAYATADGDASNPDDYRASSGRLVFRPGEQQAVVHVSVRGDSAVETDETLSVSLSEPENATLGDGSASLTIDDDDPFALSLSSPTVTEGNTGTTQATFTVELEPAPPSGTTVSVGYHLAGVTADVPGDVASAEGTLVFQPGDEEKRVTAEVKGDSTVEPNEAFRLVLADVVASGGRLVLPARSTVAIIENDDEDAPPPPPPPPGDSVAPSTAATADPAPNAAGWNSGDVTVTLAATDGGGSGVKEIAYELSGGQTGSGTVAGAQASVKVTAEGTTTLTYFATDKAGNVEAKKTLVVRIARSAPTVSCTADPGALWPPNHQLVPITVSVQVDGTPATTGFTLTSVTSNEPDDAPGGGDGDTTGDIQGFDVGTADTAGLLRAERAGSGSGRVYTLTYSARDGAGNESTCTATVRVPHDRG
jgi:alpha-tubulin suppressor-like RCC1 family protein